MLGARHVVVDIEYDLTHTLFQPKFVIAILLDYQLAEWFLHIDALVEVILVRFTTIIVLKVGLARFILLALIIFCFLDRLFFFLHTFIFILCL